MCWHRSRTGRQASSEQMGQRKSSRDGITERIFVVTWAERVLAISELSKDGGRCAGNVLFTPRAVRLSNSKLGQLL